MFIESTIPSRVLENYRTLARDISEWRVRADERAKASHGRFNIFTTLLSAHDEVRLHTRFLHCLLDPCGQHDCGSLFLDLFFDTLRECNVDLPQTPRTWKVRKEASCRHGKIDLLLECHDFGIAIENKIHAAEQDDQLARYAKYLKENYPEGQWHVIYLTLNGKESSSHGDHNYHRISYAKHILSWLEQCLRESHEALPVNLGLRQYRNVVRHLTGLTLNAEIMKEITQFIFKNPEMIRYRAEIDRAFQFMRFEFVNQLASGVIQRLKDRGYQVEYRNKDMKPDDFARISYGAFIITPIEDSPLWGKDFKVWVETDQADTLYVGLKIPDGYKKRPKEDQELLVAMNRLMDRDEERSDARRSNPNDAWPTGLEYLLHPLDDDRLAGLIGAERNGLVEAVCTDIRNHIEFLGRAYSKVAEPPVEAPESKVALQIQP